MTILNRLRKLEEAVAKIDPPDYSPIRVLAFYKPHDSTKYDFWTYMETSNFVPIDEKRLEEADHKVIITMLYGETDLLYQYFKKQALDGKIKKQGIGFISERGFNEHLITPNKN